MKRLILVGSPRTQGRSAHLAEVLFEANIADCPEDELFLVPISEVEIGPCIGCDGCKEKSSVIVRDDKGQEVALMKHRCVFDDDMQTLYDLLDEADEVTVVSPVYFAGAPAPFKCVLDRLQPYYWSDARRGNKRPLVLHVVGEGGDPHGFGALQSEVTSSFAVAGFQLQRVLDWVGKITQKGEITAEANERIVVENASGSKGDGLASKPLSPGQRDGNHNGSPNGKPRPKLNLNAKPKGAPNKNSTKKSTKGKRRG